MKKLVLALIATVMLAGVASACDGLTSAFRSSGTTYYTAAANPCNPCGGTTYRVIQQATPCAPCGGSSSIAAPAEETNFQPIADPNNQRGNLGEANRTSQQWQNQQQQQHGQNQGQNTNYASPELAEQNLIEQRLGQLEEKLQKQQNSIQERMDRFEKLLNRIADNKQEK